VLGKVASIIQKNLGNLTSTGGGLISGVLGGISALSGSAKSSAQLNATAAKILNKSPLEINDTPTSHLRQNPYEYGTVYYPSDVSNLGTGHYMIFDIVMNYNSSFKNTNFNNSAIIPVRTSKKNADFFEGGLKATGKRLISGPEARNTTGRSTAIKELGINSDRLTQAVSGVTMANPTHTHVTDSIILYTPPQVKTSYNTNYENADTGIRGGFRAGNTGGFASFLGLDALGGAGSVLIEQAVNQASALVSGFGDTIAFASKTTGTAINPNTELVFKSVPFRDFNFNFEFAPRNLKEVDSINKIINLFKFHMQPELGKTNFFVTPSEFQITYMYLENRNTYIPRISRCVLKTLELDQSPEGVFTTFAADERGAMPVYSKMSLTFTETEIMTKEKVAQGF